MTRRMDRGRQRLGCVVPLFCPLISSIHGQMPPTDQVWNLIVGQLLSTFLALSVVVMLGPSVASRALAMALAIVAMMWTDSVHPPGGVKDFREDKGAQ